MRQRRDSIFGFDLALFGCTVALAVLGGLFVYSSGLSSTGQMVSNEYVKQIVWASTGVILMFAMTLFNYARLRELSVYIYGGCLLLVVAALLFGKVVHGARAWIGVSGLGIQPSEFAKIAVVLFLAAYFSGFGRGLPPLLRLFVGGLIVLVPIGLILAQSDLGTALVYIPLFLVMAFLAGVRLRYLAFILITGALTVILSILPSYERIILGKEYPILDFLGDFSTVGWILIPAVVITALGVVGQRVLKRRYFDWVVFCGLVLTLSLFGAYVVQRALKPYQVMRFIIFLDPGVDPQGAGWNILQSQTAIGSGGFAGKGFLAGTQSHLSYLPEQSTDFIFSIIAEELGFWGGILVFALFATLLLRGIRIASLAKDEFGMLVAGGVVTLFFFHVSVNIGMAMGVMPISGIPLYLLSYGGSSTWTAFLALGILQSVYMRRY